MDTKLAVLPLATGNPRYEATLLVAEKPERGAAGLGDVAEAIEQIAQHAGAHATEDAAAALEEIRARTADLRTRMSSLSAKAGQAPLRGIARQLERLVADLEALQVARHPEPVGDLLGVLARFQVATPDLVRKALPDLAAGRREALGSLIRALEPEIEMPSRAAVLQAQRNAAARARLLGEFGGLTSAEVAEQSGSTADNRAALASRWKGAGQIFSVVYRGQQLFPGFQFTQEGQPKPRVADVIEALGGEGGWQTALWFTARNGWLRGKRPVDALDSEPDAVVEAARRETQEP